MSGHELFDPCAVGRLDKDLETTCPPPNVRQLQDLGFGDIQGLDWGHQRTLGQGWRAPTYARSTGPSITRRGSIGRPRRRRGVDERVLMQLHWGFPLAAASDRSADSSAIGRSMGRGLLGP